jgi:hypothetical protein
MGELGYQSLGIPGTHTSFSSTRARYDGEMRYVSPDFIIMVNLNLSAAFTIAVPAGRPIAGFFPTVHMLFLYPALAARALPRW